jgi:hypothetical protein
MEFYCPEESSRQKKERRLSKQNRQFLSNKFGTGAEAPDMDTNKFKEWGVDRGSVKELSKAVNKLFKRE